MDSITEIQTLIKELLAKENYTLYSFKYSEGKKSGSMEIVVDRDEDINIDDITDISNKISNLLDLHEFNNVPYTLDISSLGIEKPIDVSKLEKYLNKYINVHLTNPFKGLNTLEGYLTFVDSNSVTIEYKEKTCIIHFKDNTCLTCQNPKRIQSLIQRIQRYLLILNP